MALSLHSLDVDDTIAAVASAEGGSLQGIVRISGPATIACLEKCFVGLNDTPLSRLSQAAVVTGQLMLDEGLQLPGDLLLWPDQRSYTRQPTAEFHTFGCPSLLSMAVEKLCHSGARLAQPGEFTLRAFLSGRIDLTQAEAILAVIDASGPTQLETALQQLAGGLAGPLDSLRTQLLTLLAEIEAGLDFVEEDIEFIAAAEIVRRLDDIGSRLDALNSQIRARQWVRPASRVVLLGWPNTGKSSLFNALLNDRRAIVAPTAGTTRDFITADIEINALPIQLIDTAGLDLDDAKLSNPGPDSPAGSDSLYQRLASLAITLIDKANLELAAQIHTARQAQQARVVVLCIDNSRPMHRSEQALVTDLHKRPLRTTAASQQDGAPRLDTPGCLIVLTKIDRPSKLGPDGQSLLRPDQFVIPPIQTSSVARIGIDQLRETLFNAAVQTQNAESPVVESTLVRAADSLRAAEQALELAGQAARSEVGPEFVAAEIRQTLEHLGSVTGAVYTDDLLDAVFSRFCIGK